MSEKSLINLGDLTKPATVLIKKVSNAVGVIYEPTRIRREASARAEAYKTEAQAKLDVLEMEAERAKNRQAYVWKGKDKETQ